MDACNAGVGAFPLMLAAEGERVRVVSIAGGPGFMRRLADLGLTVGSVVEVVSRGGGPMVVARDDLRLALGGGMAHRVLVVRSDDGET